MNQILATKPVKQRKSVDIKSVIAFFAVSIIVFGICLITSGSYAIYTSMSMKNTESSKSSTVSDKNQNKYSGIQIYLSVEGSNIKAEVIGENEISFVTYRWDNDDETRAEVRSYSDEILIEIPEGEHTLTVTAVDINNNSLTKDQQVKGIVGTSSSKPKIDVTRDNGSDSILVKISDESGLDRAKIVFNGIEGSMTLDGENEKTIKCPLKEGENTIKVEVYNTNGASEKYDETINK